MNAQHRSRAALSRPAIRPAMPARFMLTGPAGSGKTWTALDIARILVGPDGTIHVIDTEAESALLYAEEHRFLHLPWEPPFDPRDLAATITDLGTDPSVCVIADSLTHFWHGQGGTLDIADSKFGGWKEATPAQDELVYAMMHCRAHFIGCVREKQAYNVSEVIEGGRKRQNVEKVGLQPQQREGLDFEFNVHGSMTMGHDLVIAKTRCRALAGKSFRANHADEMAVIYSEWLAGGQQMASDADKAALRARVVALPKNPHRTRFLAEFKNRFGSTDTMIADDLPEALALLAEYEQEAAAGEQPAQPELNADPEPQTGDSDE